MSDDVQLDDLLRVVDEPLPLRGQREQSLLTELLDGLEQGRFDTIADESDGDVVPLRAGATRPAKRPSTGVWLFRAAAILTVVVGVAWLVGSDRDTGTARDPEVDIVAPTATPTPRFDDIPAACSAYASAAPDREAISGAAAVTVAEADDMAEAFALLADDLGRRDDVDADILREVRLLEGVLVQLRSEVDAGETGLSSYVVFDDGLQSLIENDPRFELCWPR